MNIEACRETLKIDNKRVRCQCYADHALTKTYARSGSHWSEIKREDGTTLVVTWYTQAADQQGTRS